MDHYSILDQGSASAVAETNMSAASASPSPTRSVSAGIALANAHLPPPSEPGPRFPGEDGGRSLAEMAYADLDAALQLLADRAQYITGASGAAIALRRGDHNDMLCRASVGSNAPELGALLSMEYGLSGESVRTRQVLRCDDAERDPRVNREVCRELGIASVVVMPIVSEQQVLGVFELLSAKPRAFEERDLSALLRLSQMVETAVKHAVVAQATPPTPAPALRSQPQVEQPTAPSPKPEIPKAEIPAELPSDIPKGAPQAQAPRSESSTRAVDVPAPAPPSKAAQRNIPPAKPEEATPKKPLFWSAAMRAQSGGPSKPSTESIPVPPVLRNLRKCQACGFPVSQGRTFCVECEEKQWRGQRLPQPGADQKNEKLDQKFDPTPAPQSEPKPQVAAREAAQPKSENIQATFIRDSSSPQLPLQTSAPASTAPTPPAGASSDDPPANPPAPDATLFLSSALPSESWFSANKYILGALVVVALVIAAIVWLR
jgi:GAF domain-containing protein